MNAHAHRHIHYYVRVIVHLTSPNLPFPCQLWYAVSTCSLLSLLTPIYTTPTVTVPALNIYSPSGRTKSLHIMLYLTYWNRDINTDEKGTRLGYNKTTKDSNGNDTCSKICQNSSEWTNYCYCNTIHLSVVIIFLNIKIVTYGLLIFICIKSMGFNRNHAKFANWWTKNTRFYFSQVDYMNFQIPGNINVKISPCISTVFIIPSMISNEILMLIYWNVINQDYGI